MPPVAPGARKLEKVSLDGRSQALDLAGIRGRGRAQQRQRLLPLSQQPIRRGKLFLQNLNFRILQPLQLRVDLRLGCGHCLGDLCQVRPGHWGFDVYRLPGHALLELSGPQLGLQGGIRFCEFAVGVLEGVDLESLLG